MTDIIVADDHAVLREGLRALLNGVDDWKVIAEASDGFEVVSLVEKHRPDIVLLDLAMPNLGGIEVIYRLKKLCHPPAILVLSAKDDSSSVAQAMKAGAGGYLHKSSDSEELQFAVRAVLKGQIYMSPSVCSSYLARCYKRGDVVDSPVDLLSPREREVMKLLSEGTPNREVAKLLHISSKTVDSHRSNIMRKLDINSNAELVQIALKHGLVE